MGKTALITGASSGIGFDLSHIFAREGFDLLITARREERLINIQKELQERYGTKVHIYAGDLSNNDTPEKLYAYTKEKSISIDVLVNNAGIGVCDFFHQSDWNKTATMIDLNIRALTHLTRLFLPDLIQKDKAYIMNVASTAAFQPGPLMSVYYASKHYVLAFSAGISNELKDTGVVVSTLCPGPTMTEFQSWAKMEKVKLMKMFPVANSKDVAEYGFKAMMKGKQVAVYGLFNKIGAFSTRLLPRKLSTAMVRLLHKK